MAYDRLCYKIRLAQATTCSRRQSIARQADTTIAARRYPIKTYIYVLKLIPRLLREENWTELDNRIIELHFQYLQQMKDKSTLILAGKTDGLDEKTFGIVIFKSANLEEASKKAGVEFIYAAYGFGRVKDVKHQINEISELLSIIR